MNLQEVSMILLMLSAQYQREVLHEELTATLWLQDLEDLPFEVVEAAVKLHKRESEWFPNPAQIRGIALDMLDPQLSVEQAWAHVSNEISRVGLERSPDLTPLGREAVKALGGWRELCMMEEGRARPAFERAYKNLREARRRTQHMAGIWSGDAPQALEDGERGSSDGE